MMSGTKLNNSAGKSIGVAFIIIGSIVAFTGMVWLFRTATFVSTASKAPGTIIAMDRSLDGNGGSILHPVFVFTDSGGITHTQRSSFGSSSYSFEPGERVMVLYETEVPKRSKIKSFQTLWLGPVMVTGFGVVFAGFASLWLFLWIRFGGEEMAVAEN